MGTVEGWTSPALPDIEENGGLGDLSSDDLASIASLALLGALISGPPTALLIENIGRKTTIILLSIPFVIGWLLIAFAVNLPMIYVGRVLTGFCAGACSLAVPVYIGETAEDRIRGMLGSGFQLMVTLGNLFVYVVGTFVSWKWLAMTCAGVPVVNLIMMVLVPPSPKYLLNKGKVYEASNALVWLRGARSSKQVEFELNMMQASIDSRKGQKASFRNLFKLHILKPVAVCLGLMLFQQLSGIEAVLVYTVDIFDKAGSTEWLDSNISTILVGVLQVIATLVSTILVDKAGRRILLLISAITMAISMIVLGVYFYLGRHNPEAASKFVWMPLITLLCFIVAFAIGFGPLVWMMMAELLPTSVIGLASALATSFNWTLAYLVTRFFKTLSISIGFEWCFALFACFSIVGAVFVFFLVPETKGKSLDEIQAHFSGKKKNTPESQTKV